MFGLLLLATLLFLGLVEVPARCFLALGPGKAGAAGLGARGRSQIYVWGTPMG